MYKDLSKNSRNESDWLLVGNDVIAEVFDTISHTNKGDIFYARDLGVNLEALLFQLDSPELILKAIDAIREYGVLDGRLELDTTQTTVETDTNDWRKVNISTRTLGGTKLKTTIGEE